MGRVGGRRRRRRHVARLSADEETYLETCPPAVFGFYKFTRICIFFFISSFKLSGLVVLVFLPDEVGRYPELLKVRFARLLYLFNALVVVLAKK